MVDWTNGEAKALEIVQLLCFSMYLFTLLMALYNAYQYLYKMRINKCLIILFYIFIIIEVVAMGTALFLMFW